jgi:large subunit ribosomal protein L24
MIKKHVKSTKEKKGGIFEKENFVNLSNLTIISDTKKDTKKKEAKK